MPDDERTRYLSKIRRDFVHPARLTRAALDEDLTGMIDRAEALDHPDAAGYIRGYLKAIADDGFLTVDEYAWWDTVAAERLGKGWRWLDEMKAALDGLRG